MSPTPADWLFPHRVFQLDIGRIVERPEVAARELADYARWGYNGVHLYTEGAFCYASDPKIWRKHSWTGSQTKRYVEKAASHGIDVMFAVPLFGHAYWITEKNLQLDETRELGWACGQLCPRADGVLEKCEQLLADIIPYNTSEVILIGFDESPNMGRCSLCKPVLENGGEAAIFIEHLKNVVKITNRLGKTPAIAGDMFYYYPELIPQIPKDVVVWDWFYYPFEKCPRVEQYGFADMDLTGMLRKAGLRVWGLSLGYAFGFGDFFPDWTERLENVRDWARYGHEKGCEGQIITAFDARYGSRLYNHVLDAAAPLYWTPGRPPSIQSALEEGVRRVHKPRNPRPLATHLRALGKHWVAGHFQTRHLYRQKPAEVVKYQLLADESVALRDCVKLAPRLPGIYRLAARTRVYLARKSLECNRVALGKSEGGAVFARLANEAKTLMREHGRLWKAWRYGDGLGEDYDEHSLLLHALKSDVAWFRELARSKPDVLRPRMLCFNNHYFMPGVQHMKLTLERDGTEDLKFGPFFFIEFRDKHARPGCKCVRPVAVPIPGDAVKFRFRFEVMPYGPLGVSGLTIREGARRIPFEARVIGREGEVKRTDAIFRKGPTFCAIGDHDPRAQTESLERRARRHFVTIEMKLS